MLRQNSMLIEIWTNKIEIRDACCTNIEKQEANVNATVKGNRKEVTQWKAVRNQQSKGQRQIEPLTVSLIFIEFHVHIRKYFCNKLTAKNQK